MTVDVLIAARGQADGLDVGRELDVVLHGQDGHVVPLKQVSDVFLNVRESRHHSPGYWRRILCV